MSGLLIFLGTILFILAVAFSLYVRWWLGRAVNEKPRVQVQVKSSETTTVVRLTTRGTRRQFRLKRLTVPRAGASAEGVHAPGGFRSRPATDDVITWEPRRPVILPPGHPFDLRITHEPGHCVTVQGEAESKLAIGGTSVRFAILVREDDGDRRTLFNRQSALYAEAAERGVPAHALPDWERVQALEARVRRSAD